MPQIVVRLQGGLGNQLFILSAGYVASLKYGYSLAVDLSEYDSYKSNPRYLEIQEILNRNQIPISSRTPKRVFNEKLPYVYDSGIENIKGDTLMLGYFQSQKYFECFHKEIKDLILSPLNRKELMKTTEAIGVHMRRGDYLKKESQIFHGLTSVDFFLTSASVARSIWGDLPISIFSDTKKEAEKLKGLLINSKVFRDKNLNSFQTLIQLARHRIIIGSNSSFSWWSSFLGEKSYGEVFFPKKWNRKMEVNELRSDSWIVID